MTLIFATQNEHKRAEVQAILGAEIHVESLLEFPVDHELPETHETLEENALEKALYIHQKFNVNCFSEDTGLEITVLHGAPGVYSARYAGEGKNATDNIRLVLEQMKETDERSARFRTVVCLYLNKQHYFFEGVVNGTIARKMEGAGGFGYDPVFIPEGHQSTFAAMSAKEKNAISHRRIAIEKMRDFLLEYASSSEDLR